MKMRTTSMLLILLLFTACASQQLPSHFRHHSGWLVPKDKVAFLILHEVVLISVDGKNYRKNSGIIEFLPGTYNMSFLMRGTIIGNHEFSSKISVSIRITLKQGCIYQASRSIGKVNWKLRQGRFNWNVNVSNITDNEQTLNAISYKDTEPVLDDVKAFNNRARAYVKLEKYKNAIADLDKSVKLDPNNSKTHALRSFVYVRMEKYEKAILESNEAIELNHLNPTPFNNRGFAYKRLGIYNQAILDFNRAIKIEQDDLYYANAGDTYRLMDKHNEAIKYYKKAINVTPTKYSYTNDLGDIYKSLGDMDRACKEWKKAHDIKFGNSLQYLVYCYNGPVYNVSRVYLDMLPVSKNSFIKPKSSTHRVNFKDNSHFLWIDDKKWSKKKWDINFSGSPREVIDNFNKPYEITHFRGGGISVFLDTKTPPIPLLSLRNDLMNNFTTVMKLKDINLDEEFRNINGKKILSLNLTARSKKIKSGKVKIHIYLSYSHMGTNSLVLSAPEDVYYEYKSDIDDLLNGLATTQANLTQSGTKTNSSDKKIRAKKEGGEKLAKLDSLFKKGLLSEEDYEYNKNMLFQSNSRE